MFADVKEVGEVSEIAESVIKIRFAECTEKSHLVSI